MAAPRRANLIVVNQDTGAVETPAPRVPHRFDGRGYTMQSRGNEVPLYQLRLTATEWSVIEWLREHGAAAGAIKAEVPAVAEDIDASEQAVKNALGRLVRMNVTLRTAPRSSTYQLNPRRYWEGSGAAQNLSAARIDPPAITPDPKGKPRASRSEGDAR